MSLALFHAEVNKQGDLKWHDARGLERFLRGNTGRHFKVSFNEPKRQRSDKQHKYYFGCLVKRIADFAGMAPDEAHEGLKAKYLRKEKVGGIWRIGSTKDLSTKEFEDLCERIRADAATGELLGAPVVLPLPNEPEEEW